MPSARGSRLSVRLAPGFFASLPAIASPRPTEMVTRARATRPEARLASHQPCCASVWLAFMRSRSPPERVCAAGPGRRRRISPVPRRRPPRESSPPSDRRPAERDRDPAQLERGRTAAKTARRTSARARRIDGRPGRGPAPSHRAGLRSEVAPGKGCVLTAGVATAPLVPVETGRTFEPPWLAETIEAGVPCCAAGLFPQATPPRPPRARTTRAGRDSLSD